MKVNFKELLENEIKKEVEQRAKRVRSGKFSPSSMGKCFRRQFFSRKNIPETNPIPIDVYKKFRAGTIYHEDLQSLVDNTEVEYSDDHFKCFADHVGEDYVTDFKTVASWLYKGSKYKKGLIELSRAEIEREKSCEIIQLMTYCHLLKKPTGYLVFVNKDDYGILQVEFELKDYQAVVDKEISTLLHYWEKDELPPPEPRVYGTDKKSGKPNECLKYCPYKNHCEGVENDK